MANKPVSRARAATLILGCVGAALVASSDKAGAQGAAPSVAAPESASDALSRHLRVLATAPRKFEALIGAGRASLQLGDLQAAAGFFGRADEVWPSSPLPQIGMGAATALGGDARSALAHFARALQLGASPVTMGADRGLAFDLLGQHAGAQADYRAALVGSEGDEARRRLALSLAITGDKAGALAALSPLLQRSDMAAVRTRALVLALTGDQAGARAAIEWTMPGGWAQMAPFLLRLGSLNSAQKAAAVHLGIFPEPGQLAGVPGQTVAAPPGDRLAGIDPLLRGSPTPQQAAPRPSNPVPTAVAPRRPVTRPNAASAGAATSAAAASVTVTPSRRYWVQLASGPNAVTLPSEYERIRERGDELLGNLSGYVAEERGKARLLVGPFRNQQDSRIFVEELETLDIHAFSWVSPEGQPIRKITSE